MLGGGSPPQPPRSGVSLSPVHLVPAVQRVFLLEVELNASLGLIADSTAGFSGGWGELQAGLPQHGEVRFMGTKDVCGGKAWGVGQRQRGWRAASHLEGCGRWEPRQQLHAGT